MPNPPIGIDLGGTKLLLFADGKERQIATGPTFTARQLVAALEQFILDYAITPSGIGLTIPGLLNPDGSVLRSDVLPNLDGWNPRMEIQQNLGCPVAVLNDIDAALLEELHDAPADTTAAVIMVGTGVGAAFMMDGKLLKGHSGLAGELGYMPIQTQGAFHRLDELAGGAYMAKTLGVDGATLAQKAQTQDAEALEVIATGGHYLGLGLATVINLFNPSLLVLGGGATRLPGYFDAACASAAQHSFAETFQQCRIIPAKSGHLSAAKGAIRAVQLSIER
jgi:predicted NBD/HSP70 family sugar kinase